MRKRAGAAVCGLVRPTGPVRLRPGRADEERPHNRVAESRVSSPYSVTPKGATPAMESTVTRSRPDFSHVTPEGWFDVGHGLLVALVEVTPELATTWLTCNHVN